MPYVPYWFESFAAWFPWIVPALSILSLWIARLCDDARVRSNAERIYFIMMLVVATATLRTILADEPCWLLHTGSLCLMVVGAIFPQSHADGAGVDLPGDLYSDLPAAK
ncbi:MAG: hypothetical protein MUF23_00405 [Pirellula sp.]|jgi:hypothetical protein|nr:hypothetical protein [Pirellula sp.]